MLPASRITIAVVGLTLALGGCSGGGAAPTPSGVPPTTVAPTESSPTGPATVPLDGTELVDPASAVRVSDGRGVMSEVIATFGNGGARDVTVALAPDGDKLVMRIPAGALDQGAIVKPSAFAWFDGTFQPVGSTADLVPGGAFTQNFNEWTDGEAVAWVESPSIQAQPYPWHLFAAPREGGPVLIATSDDTAQDASYPTIPEPVVYEGRVYWQMPAPPGVVTGTGTWSAPLTEGTPQLELTGARNPAATDAGVFSLSHLWGPEGDAGLEPGAVRVVRVDGDTRDQTLRTLDVNPDGRVGTLLGAGRWLAAPYHVGFAGGGITVFSATTGEGYSVAELDEPFSAGVALCDAALVWMEPDEDWLADTIYRLDLDTGELLAIDAPRAFRVDDCEGNDVLWSQTDGGGGVKQYVTTVG